MTNHEPIACQSVFVYGTLQRGECRARHWPHPPEEVLPATVRGRLFDLGPFPALVAGNDLVAGELWRLSKIHIAETLRVLDQVEAAAGDSANLYIRQIVSARLANGDNHTAWAYFFARPAEIAPHQLILPDQQGVCRWRPGAS